MVTFPIAEEGVGTRLGFPAPIATALQPPVVIGGWGAGEGRP